MSRAAWTLFYVAGGLGLALAAWHLLLTVATWAARAYERLGRRRRG